MPVSSVTEHWIKQDAIIINLNHFGDPDYLQVSVLAGAVVMAFKQDVIGYNAARNYRTWPLQAANTFFETTDALNVYAHLTRSEVNASALIIYDPVLRDIEGRSISYADDGSEILGEADAEYYYIYLGQISSSIDSDGNKVDRHWSVDFRFGNLDTSEQNNFSGLLLEKMFKPHYDDKTNPNKLTSIEALAGLWTKQFLSSKGMNSGGGSGGGSGDEPTGGATTLGGLRNVADAADSTYDVAKMLVLEADSNLWTLKNLSDLVGGLDEAELEQYLTSNKYVTEQWLLNNEYATQRDIDARINALVNGAPAAYDTLKEIADALQGNVNGINDILTALGTKVGRDEFNAAVDSIYDELDTKLDIDTFAELFEKVRLSDGTYAIKAKLGLFSDVFLSTKGANNSGTSSIGGASALYQLNDVAKNSSVDGVLGATQGALLMYNGDKWQGVSQRDIVPNLDGYATEDLLYRALNSYQPLITTTNKLPYSLIGDAPDVYTKAEMDSALMGYLPLSGGTISNTTPDALTIDRNSTNPTYICFKNNGALLGYIGINTSKEPVVSINGIKKLIHSGNIDEQSVAYATSAGDAATLGGVDRNSILELPYKGYTRLNAAGWYRIGKFKRVSSTGNVCRLYLYRGYGAVTCEAYIFDIIYTHQHRYCITQTAGHFVSEASQLITKIRIDSISSTSSYSYLDIYYEEDKQNSVYWMSEGCLESYTEATPVDVLTGSTAIEFETANGCKTSKRFFGDVTGDLTGNAESATKLQTARTIWGQSFDGTGDITGKLKLSNGTAGGLGVLDADGNVVNAVTLSSRSELYFGYDAPSKGINTYLRGNTIRLNYGADNTVGFVLNTLGRIGIGTTNPNYKVHVVGEILLTPKDTGGLFYRVKNDNYELNFGLGSTGGNRGIYDRTNSSWLIYRDATTNVLIPKGNLGVGIINPLYKLDVDGATRTTKLVIGDGTIEWDAEHKGFKVTGGIYTESYLSAKGVSSSNDNPVGGLIKSLWKIGDLGKTFSDADNDTFNAYTINEIHKRVSLLEGKATNVTYTANQASGTLLGTLTIDGASKTIYAPTIPTSDINKGVTAYNWGNHASVGYAMASALNGYMPLSGGTIDGSLTVVNGHLVAPHLRFSVDGTEKILTPYAAFDNDLSYYDGTSWYRVIHSGNIGSQSVSYAERAGNSTALGGKSLSNGNYTFDSVPYIKSDGVMEVGKYIDFHNDNTTGNDYDCRLDIQGAHKNTVHLPTDSGVLALTTSNVASADKLSDNDTYTIWGQTFFVGGKPKSVSGDAIGLGGYVNIENDDEINRYGGDLYIQYRGNGTGGNTTGNVMMCSNGGNVGIGIEFPDTPRYRLEVNGSLNAKVLYQDGQTLDNYYATVSLVDELVAALQGQIDGLWHRNGFNELSAEHIMADSLAVAMLMSNTIRTSGSASIGTTLYAKDGIWSDGYVSAKGQNTSSDMRLKNVLNEVVLGVKDIANAPSVRFAWKNGGGVDVGSSAQYWQVLLPDAVKEHDGWLEMQYANIALLSAIALAKNFETMEERVARLEQENEELRTKIDMMERRIA